jgi:hypothetical protein
MLHERIYESRNIEKASTEAAKAIRQEADRKGTSIDKAVIVF